MGPRWRPDFRLGPGVEAFRTEVRSFLDEVLGSRRAAGRRDRSDLTGWDEGFEREVLRAAGRARTAGCELAAGLRRAR